MHYGIKVGLFCKTVERREAQEGCSSAQEEAETEADLKTGGVKACGLK